MPSFKSPSFQDRVASADKARQKALEQLKQRPPLDEAVIAERRRAAEAREQAAAEKRAAKAEALAAQKAERAEKAAAIAAARAEEEAAAALKARPPEAPQRRRDESRPRRPLCGAEESVVGSLDRRGGVIATNNHAIPPADS